MNCTNSENADSKNPKRVAAGRRNRLKRKGLTPEGRQRLRETALKHRPWQNATGPRTVSGKQRAAQNGKARQSGTQSVREIRSELAGVQDLIRQMRAVTKQHVE